jgi:hypothetical protein
MLCNTTNIHADDGRAENLRQMWAADWKTIVAAKNTGTGKSIMFILVQSWRRSKPDFPGLQSNAASGMVNPHGGVVTTPRRLARPSSRSPNAGRSLKMKTRPMPWLPQSA